MGEENITIYRAEELATEYARKGESTEGFKWAKYAYDNSDEYERKFVGAAYAFFKVTGQGTEKDVQGGMELLKQLEKCENKEAIKTLGNLYHTGAHIPKDDWRATYYYEKLTTGDDTADICRILNQIYNEDPEILFGAEYKSVIADFENRVTAISPFEKDPEASIRILYMGMRSSLNIYDIPAFICMLSLAPRPFLSAMVAKTGAERDNAFCSGMYGHFILKGTFFEQDDKKAFIYINRGLKTEYPQTRPTFLYDMGYLFVSDNDVITDEREGLLCLKECLDLREKYGLNTSEVVELIQTVLEKTGASKPEPVKEPAPAPTPVVNHAPAPAAAPVPASSPVVNHAPLPAATPSPVAHSAGTSPKSPFRAVQLFAAAAESDYWNGVEVVNTINRDVYPYAMFNLILKRPIFKPGNYTLKYVITNGAGEVVCDSATVIALGVGNDRLAQAFTVKDDPDGTYTVNFSLTELGMAEHSFTYRLVSGTGIIPPSNYVPCASSEDNIAAVLLKGTSDGSNFWGGTDLTDKISHTDYVYAAFNMFNTEPYFSYKVIEIRMVIRDDLGNIVYDDITKIEVNTGNDRLAKMLALSWEGKHYVPGRYYAEFTIDDCAPYVFTFEIE